LKERRCIITPEILSKRWYISLEAAHDTMNVTTQAGVRNVYLYAEWKVHKKATSLRFPNLDATFYVDSLFSLVKSIYGHTGGSNFTDDLGFNKFFPWNKKSSNPDDLMQFIHTVGIPNTIVSNNALEETRGRSSEIMQEYRIHLQTTAPHSPWKNRAEACIRELKKYVCNVLCRTGAPVQLWT
jgi:hypothetical protein